MVARAGDVFDDEGNLTDQVTRERLAEFISGYAGSL